MISELTQTNETKTAFEVANDASIPNTSTLRRRALMQDAINELPFKLTGAQARVLEEIDKEVSSITDNEIDYKVTTAEIIPTRSGIETNIIEEHSYNKDGIEVEEKYPKINYHISDDKVDTTFGAKSRFDDNVKAIELLKQLELEDRNATKEEQDILSRYVGWGGISDAFDERKPLYDRHADIVVDCTGNTVEESVCQIKKCIDSL